MSLLVRRLINEILTLEKDEERIKKKISSRTSDEVYDDQGQEDWGDYSRRDANQQRVHDERELKRIWAEEVKEEGTRDFFDKELVKIHWIGAYSDDERDPVRGIADYIRKYGTKKSRDEVSCFAYERWDGAAWDDSIPEASSFGVIVKGYTTYASTIDAKTHMPSKADDEAKKKHKSSGLHKRPTKFKGNEEKDSTSLNAGYMIVDKESFGKRRRDFHEVLVDNWSPSEAFVIKDLKYFELEEKQWRKKAEYTPVEEFKEETLRLKAQREEDLAFIAKSGFKIYDRRFREQAIPNPFEFDDKKFFENTWRRLASDDDNDRIFSTVVLKDSPPEESFTVTKKTMNLRTIDLKGKLTFDQCRFDSPNKGGIECSTSGATITFNRCSGRLGRILSGAVSLGFISIDFGGSGYNSLEIRAIEDKVSIPQAKFKDCNFGDGKVLIPFIKRFLNQDVKLSMDGCKLDEASSKQVRNMIGARNVEEFFKILEKPLPYKWQGELTPPPGLFLAPPPPTMTGSQTGNLPPLPPLPNLPPLPTSMSESRLLKQLINEILIKEMPQKNEPFSRITVGDMKQALAYAKGKKSAEAMKIAKQKAAKAGVKTILSFIPGAEAVTQAIETGLELKDIYDTAQGAPPEAKKNNPLWDLLTIDPDKAAIVDDHLEHNFIDDLDKRIQKLPDNKAIPDADHQFDIWLSNKYHGAKIVKQK